ncbi:sugar ABC transporter ATP-binding protein [Cryobacterium gelidum]|uniref:Sugar ABC transporter ATP-binding protein n=1 Tax=Cryobacterium gelidum TaxID=1259164 RepID=A0A4R9B0U2_9MICO|nr:sugar ABC transporter ATP-binding protein [Cryobacterium gelidum]TFD73614.1 sugar ABC transporter ATP-binding protein [Cryobacterium gelidum]
MYSTDMKMASEPRLGTLPAIVEARGLGKRYPGVVALDDVSLVLRAGEIHALLGENGAGKSTLIGLLSGITSPDSGEMLVDGQVRNFTSPRQAQDLGISTIYQEQTLAPHLTVIENVFFGRELKRGPFLDERAMRRRVEALSDEFGLSKADLELPTGSLGALKQHVVQILKALAFDARVVILDEPTSGLEDNERQMLFDHMLRMRERGVAILWVTHRLDELFGLADVITVLRDSRWVAHVTPADQTPDSLVRLMVGRTRNLGELSSVHDGRVTSSGTEQAEVLRMSDVTRLPLLRDISLTVRQGEILGIAGIAGAGRTELARIILGADRPDSGEVFVRGRKVLIKNPQQATQLGIYLVPEERKTQSILGTMSIEQNISISSLNTVSTGAIVLNNRKERTAARRIVTELGIRCSAVTQKIGTLSGGNQQKVIIARSLFSQPSLLIFDEPTQGIDVAAKTDIYRLIYEFVDQGGAAIVISSELPELVSLSDRIVVMREGRLVGELAGSHRNTGVESDNELAENIMALVARAAKQTNPAAAEADSTAVNSAQKNRADEETR